MRIVTSQDISGLVDKLKRIGQDVPDKAVVRAVNKIAAQTKTQAAREIKAAGYGLKVSDIKNAISIFRANRGLIVATVRARGRPIGLIKYGARAVRGGVTVSVKGGRKFIKGAFIQTMPNGHRGVYEVKNGLKTWRREAGHSVRNTIEEKFGPSIPAAFVNKIVREQLIAFIRDKFPAVLQQEINFLSLKR